MTNNSTLTFNDLTQNLPFIKVSWNGIVVYDDTAEPGEYDLGSFFLVYGDKVVYEMDVKVVDFHHCEIIIIGEGL